MSKIDDMRWFQIKKSFGIFWDSNMAGIGSGNWHLAAYDQSLADISGLDHSVVFIRLFNHNFYSNLLAELGVIGMFSFIIPFLILTYKLIKRKNDLSDFEKACFLSIVVYLMGSLFFGATNMNVKFFSEIHLVTWISFGLLSNRLFPTRQVDNRLIIVVTFLCLVCISWLVYVNSSEDKYKTLLKITNNAPLHHMDYIHYDTWANEIKFDKEIPEIIKGLKKIYHPCFNTSFYNSDFIPLRIGRLEFLDGNYSEAKLWFEKSLEHAPNNELALMNLAYLYLSVENNVHKAMEFAQRVYNQQSNHEGANILMAEILIRMNRLDEAEAHLLDINCFETRYKNYCRLLMADIFVQRNDFGEAQIMLDHVKSKLPRIVELKSKYDSLITQKR